MRKKRKRPSAIVGKSPLATVENIKTLGLLLAESKKAKPEDKFAIWDKYLTEIIERIAPEMTPKKQPKLTTTIAIDMVKRIEALQDQIDDIYAEARSYDGTNNDSVIHDAVSARREKRDAQESEDALLGSFDAEDVF